MEAELDREEEESARLRAELREVEEREQAAGEEFHRQWVALERMQQEIGEQEEAVACAKQMQEHITAYGKAIDEAIK